MMEKMRATTDFGVLSPYLMKSDKTLSYIYDWAGISIWNINKVMIKYGTIRINGRQDASNLMYYRHI